MNGEPAGWKVEDGIMIVVPRTGDIMTKETFTDFFLHLEFRCPDMPEAKGQAKALPTYVQTSDSTSRDSLINEIKACAERHVKSKTEIKTEHVVNIYSGKELTSQEITKIYEEEYIRLKEASKPSPWKRVFPHAFWAHGRQICRMVNPLSS